MPKRTTVTLDDDLLSRLDSESRRAGTSFRETLNEAIRRGLDRSERKTPSRRFKVVTRTLGRRQELDVDNVEELLDQVEGAWRR